MHPQYRLEKASDPLSGSDRVWRAGLFLNDEERSRVMYLVDPYHQQQHQIKSVWLAVEKGRNGREVGMAMVSDPADDSGELPVLNVYVHPDHLNQGIGSALIDTALAEYPAGSVAGYYTSESVRLYRARNLVPAMIYRIDEVQAHLDAGDISAAREASIARVLADREKFDRVEARYGPIQFR